MACRSSLLLAALVAIGAMCACNAQISVILQRSLCSASNRFGFRSDMPNASQQTKGFANRRVKREAPGTCPTVPTQRITDHFKNWLDTNGYAQYDFSTNGCGKAGSFGGRTSPNDAPSGDKRPVIFVHGATDGVMGLGNVTGNAASCGWSQVFNHFMHQGGYKMADLYATTWGANDKSKSGTLLYITMYMERINKFIEAVLKYTGASQVDIIAHSMGVPLSRAAIVGDLSTGPDLSSRVKNFIGIAGPNPDVKKHVKIAENIFSICTPSDHLIRMTVCPLPGQKCGSVIPDLTHSSVRSSTPHLQLKMLRTGDCK